MSSDWSLSPAEFECVSAKPTAQRLGFALQLKVYSLHGRFFETVREAPVETIEILAQALMRPISDVLTYDWGGRTGRRHREEILKLGGALRMSVEAREEFRVWLVTHVCPTGQTPASAIEQAEAWCRQRGLRAPSRPELERLIRSARREFETQFLEKITDTLSAETASKLDASLAEADATCGFHDLKADPGRAGLENLVRMAQRLTFLRGLGLPRELLLDVDATYLAAMRRRVGQELAWEMRRHPRARRLGMYAVFL